MTLEEVKEIAKADKKAILPTVYFAMFLAIAGWIWNLAVAQARQDEHEKRISLVEKKVEPISVMQNEITHIKKAVDELRIQQRSSKQEILEAITHGNHQ